MEEKVENNDSCVGFGEDHHRSADDMIGKEASPIEDRDKNNGGLAPCAGGPTPEPQLLQQGETAGAAGASELPVVVEGRDDETEGWLKEANEFLQEHRLDGGGPGGLQARREAGIDYLAETLLRDEALLSRLVEIYCSRGTGEKRPRSAGHFWRRPPANASSDAGADIVFFKLLRLSRLVRCEAERKVAIQSPAMEVCQGVSFKWRIAAIMGHLSQLVYDISDGRDGEKALAAEKCRKWIADDNVIVEYFHSPVANTKADNAAILVKSASDIFIVFRGSASWTNWRQNSKLGYRPFPIPNNDRAPQSNVHQGFFDAQDSLWPDLQTLECFQRSHPGDHQQDRNVWIGGHSLGGAMAIITAARLVSELGVERIDGVYTFGSPSLFNSAAVSRYRAHPVLKGRTFRVKYGFDIVPRILSRSLRSPGIPIRMTERDGMSERRRRKHDRKRFSYLPLAQDELFARDNIFLGIKQHGMKKSYLGKLDKIAREAGAGITFGRAHERGTTGGH